MRIAVMGAGAMGLLFAAKLAEAGETVIVIARSEEQAAALRQDGVTLETGGERQCIRVSEALSYSEAPGYWQACPELDYVLLTVKQPAIDPALLDFLAQSVPVRAAIVCLQNGIGHEQAISRAVGPGRVLLGVTTEAARKLDSCRISHTGQGTTYIGPVQDAEHAGACTQKLLADVLEKAGFKALLSKDMNTRVWNKLIINSVINPLTAILQVRNGRLLESAQTVSLMESLYREAAELARAAGIIIADDMFETILQVCEATADNHSSMLQDRLQARTTEIDNMNGSLLRIAEELGMRLTAHQTVYRLMKALENK